ncbi:MAG TPA: valine--pyruvate transaminase [Anaerolineae bacterium]|nr:valine--pyruvate transaminase [Anaerolineae bacterium]
MRFSKFGQKFTAHSGILQLMADLGDALSSDEPMMMLGGGNPAKIPQVQRVLRQHMYNLLLDEDRFDSIINDYAPPAGNLAFRKAMAQLLGREFGWKLGPENIALTNGSQTAFFYLFNLFGGEAADGTFRRILLPLTPEYIGYANVGVVDDLFVSAKPSIEYLDDVLYKYHVDFAHLEVGDDIAAICVSRPTNPTGNVLTDDEMAHLAQIAHKHDIPLIIDGAYGTPFPNIIFTEAKPLWDDHVVLLLSLSKLGMPGTRTGIVVANESIISAIASMNAIASLAPGNIGAGLALDMTRTGEIIRLGHEVVGPYYRSKAEKTLTWFAEFMGDTPYRIHKPEGAFFLWVWFPDLPITSAEFYTRLKARGVIVVPGHYFFPGLKEDWRHRHECLRVSYAQEDDVVRRGIAIIAEEARRAYG